MRCLDENTAVELVEGTLATDRADEARAHVDDCSDCRKLVAGLALDSPDDSADPKGPTAAASPAARGRERAIAIADTLASDPGGTDDTLASGGSDGDTASRLQPGGRISRYDIERELGQGGMGAVYLASDPELHRRVAIKVMHSGTPDAADRMLREARAMAKLRHPNVVTVYEVGRDGADVFVAMEFIEGQTLRSWLEDDRTLAERLDVLGQAGRGLAAAHDKGLVHRDFKPDNVMVGDDGRVQVLDFGLAKPSGATVATDSTIEAGADVSLTRSGALVGTPAYMAPEQFALDTTDARTDQFSFCVALFEALHGERPYPGKTIREIAEAVAKGDIRPEPRNGDVSAALSRAVERGLSPKPADRFATMHPLLDVLASKPAAGKRLAFGLISAGVVVAAAAAYVGLSGGSDASEPADETAAILAQSNLPTTVAEPLADDPLAATVHRLSNGLTVYISRNHARPRVMAHVVVRAGSSDDPPDTPGVAHMVEHMLFKGTDKVGTIDFAAEKVHLDRIDKLYRDLETATDPAERTRIQAAVDAENVAASRYAIPTEFNSIAAAVGADDVNGQVGRDFSVFSADIPSHRLPQWAKLEAERMSGSVFRLFHHEIGTIFNERRDTWDSSERRVISRLERELFPEHPYGKEPIGTYDDILAEPFHATRDFYRRWFVPNNAALVLVGDVDPEQVIPVLEREFAIWRPRPLPVRAPRDVPMQPTPIDVVEPTTGERYMLAGWRGPSRTHADQDAMTILVELINGKGSPIQERVTGKLVRFGVGYAPQAQAGYLFVFGVALPNQTADSLLAVMQDAVDMLSAGKFTDEHFEALMANYRFGFLRTRQTNKGRAQFLLDSYLSGEDWQRSAYWEKRLGAITRDDVIRVAKKYLGGHRVVVRAQPGARDSIKAVPPQISTLDLDPNRSSQFAAKFEDLAGVARPPRFVFAGRDYQVDETPAGPIISVRNDDNTGLFSLELRWAVGSRSLPGVCVAAQGLEQAVSVSAAGIERRRAWYRQPLFASIECTPDRVWVSLEGVDSRPEAVSEVLEWLRGGEFDAERWKTTLGSHSDWRRIMRGRPEYVRQTSKMYALAGEDSPFLAMPSAAKLASLSVDDMRDALSKLLATKRAMLYYGPRRGPELRKFLSADNELADAPPSPPRAYKFDRPLSILLFDGGAAGGARISMLSSTGAITESTIPVAELYSRCLSDGMDGLLPTALRSERGGSYLVHSEAWVPSRTVDAGYFASTFSADPTQLAELVKVALSVVRVPALDKARVDAARKGLEEEYRSNWVVPRELPGTVERWRQRGLSADPRVTRFTALEALTQTEVQAFAAKIARANMVIVIVADLSSVDRASLEAIGPVEVVDLSRVLPK